jgi:hypothetical protein
MNDRDAEDIWRGLGWALLAISALLTAVVFAASV